MGDPMDMVDTDTLWAMPATDTATDTDTLWATPDMVATTARGPLMLSQPLMPPPILTTMVDTDMATAMEDTDTDTATEDTAMDTTARGPLMLSLPLMPPPIPTTDTAMEDTAMDTVMDTVMDLTMADMVMDTVMDTAMDTATTVKYLPSSSYLLQTQNQGDHQDLSVNKMDYVSLSSTLHQCYQFQCRQPSNIRNDEQEATENQHVMIRQ